MSNTSEFKILRNEIARLTGQIRKRDDIIENFKIQHKQQNSRIEQQNIRIEQILLENKMLRAEKDDRKRMAYYENPYSPPSHNSTQSRWRKARTRKDPAD